MSFINPQVPQIVNPVGVDAAVQTLQTSLSAALPWLSRCYGLATTGLTKQETDTRYNKNEYKYPEVYVGNSEYLALEPNNYLNAHAFFKAEAAQEAVDYQAFHFNRYRQRVSIVFWINLDKVKTAMGYTYAHRFTEELKRQILDVLRNHSHFTVQRIHETPQDVFSGYSYNHLDNQTFKHPEAGFKFEGVLLFNEKC